MITDAAATTIKSVSCIYCFRHLWRALWGYRRWGMWWWPRHSSVPSLPSSVTNYRDTLAGQSSSSQVRFLTGSHDHNNGAFPNELRYWQIQNLTSHSQLCVSPPSSFALAKLCTNINFYLKKTNLKSFQHCFQYNRCTGESGQNIDPIKSTLPAMPGWVLFAAFNEYPGNWNVFSVW